MDYWSNIILGFQQAFQPINFIYCFIGVTLGTLVGVLPGIGPVATISMLLPVAFLAPSLASIIMLAGIYYGAMYGGSTTSILVNIPGEAASVVTCLDGHQMAKLGRAGPALGISALGSFIGGTLSIFGLVFFTIPLSSFAIRLGPPEYFGLLSLGIVMVVYISSGSFLKGIVMAIIGFILGCVGTDITAGKIRFAYGIFEFYDGIEIVALVIGLFGVSEVLINITSQEESVIFKTKVKNLLPNLQDWKKSILPISRGSILGFFIGLIPGGGTILASFISYAVEKKLSKHPDEFGKGAIEGVAGPETANNAAVAGAFIPLFALGIPSNAAMAIILVALMMHGVTPGPGFIAKNQVIFWGFIASMYIGNIMLLVLNLPLISIWIKILDIPYKILFPLILLFCVIGAYSINCKTFDVLVMIVFGLVGYILKKHEYDLAPLVLAFILGPMFELSFRQTVTIASGRLSFLLTKPIAAVALLLSLVIIAYSIVGFFWKLRMRNN